MHKPELRNSLPQRQPLAIFIVALPGLLPWRKKDASCWDCSRSRSRSRSWSRSFGHPVPCEFSTGVWQPDSFLLFRNFFSATCVWKLPVSPGPPAAELVWNLTCVAWCPGGACLAVHCLVGWWATRLVEGRSRATLELLLAGQNWTKARRCLHLLLKIYMQSAAGVRKMFVAIFVPSYPASGKGIFVVLPSRL